MVFSAKTEGFYQRKRKEDKTALNCVDTIVKRYSVLDVIKLFLKEIWIF